MYTRSVTERGLPNGTDADLLGALFGRLADRGPLARLARMIRKAVGPRGVVEAGLAEGRMISVSGFDEVVVSCRDGLAIVTAEGVERDVVLGSGESTLVTGRGKVVATAGSEGVRISMSGS